MTIQKEQNLELAVQVENHLLAELELVEQLDALNLHLAESLSDAGARGIQATQTKELTLQSDRLAESSQQLKSKRDAVLRAINSGRGESQTELTIRQYIATLPPGTAVRLEEIRHRILDRLTDIHASMLGNQAVLFYSYEFYQKMVSNLINCDPDEQKYGDSGQSKTIQTGNFIRKAC